MAAALLLVTVSKEEHGCLALLPVECVTQMKFLVIYLQFISLRVYFHLDFLFVNERNPCPVPLVK